MTKNTDQAPYEAKALENIAGPEWGDLTHDAIEVALGDVATIYSRGQLRTGVISKVGRKNVTLTYTTPGALKEAAKTGEPINFTNKSEAKTEVYGPLAAGERPMHIQERIDRNYPDKEVS